MHDRMPVFLLLLSLCVYAQDSEERVYIEEIGPELDFTLDELDRKLNDNPEAGVDLLIRLEWQARGKDRNKLIEVPFISGSSPKRGRRYQGAHRWLVEKIAALKPRLAAYYRDQVEAEAVSLRKGYELTGELPLLWQLLDGYRYSSHGSWAAEQLQARALENGDTELSVGYGDLAIKLAETPSNQVRLRQLVALLAQQHFAEAEAVLAVLPHEGDAPGGTSWQAVHEELGRLFELQRSRTGAQNLNAQRLEPEAQDDLPGAAWGAAGQMLYFDMPAGAVGLPILHDDKLYYNAGTQTFAVDLRTGASQTVPFQATAVEMPPDQQHLLHGGTIDHGVLYTNMFSVRADAANMPLEEGALGQRLYANLYAFDLSRDLATLWTTSDLSYTEQKTREQIESVHYSSTPLVLGEFVFATAMTIDQESEVFVNCFRAGANEYGRPDLLWRHFLVARSDQAANNWGGYGEVTKRMHPSTLASYRGRVIVNTNYGATVCLEPFSGDILWLHRYVISDAVQANNEFNGWGQALNPGLAPSPMQAWNQPVLDRNPRNPIVICAPFDSHMIYWLLIEDGHVPAWTDKSSDQKKSDKMAVLGPWQPPEPDAPTCLLIYGGNEFEVIDFKTSLRLMGGARKLASDITGPAVIRGSTFYFPTENGLEQFTLVAENTGKVIRRTGLPRFDFEAIPESLELGGFENNAPTGRPLVGRNWLVLPTDKGVYLVPRDGTVSPEFEQGLLEEKFREQAAAAPEGEPDERLRIQLRGARLMPGR